MINVKHTHQDLITINAREPQPLLSAAS